MLQVSQSADRCVLTSENLRLEFQRKTDRWQHTISVLRNEEYTPLLKSVEGQPDNPLPPSPAFQELLLEKKGDHCHEVQLFGQAGKNLYAAAIKFDAQLGKIEFDISVRMRGTEMPEAMVSTYRLATGVEAELLETGDGVRLTGLGITEPVVLQGRAIEGSPVCGVDIQANGEIRMGYLTLGEPAEGGALRWGYEVG